MARQSKKDRRAVTIDGVVHDPDFGQMSPHEHVELVADIRRKIEEGAAEADRGELIDGKLVFAYLRSIRDASRSE